MKILSTISLIFLIGCLIQTSLSQQCIEYSSPFNKNEIKMVDCPMATFNDKRQASPTPTSDDLFKIDFQCLITNETLCNKVNNVFVTAGKFITATLNLNSPVI